MSLDGAWRGLSRRKGGDLPSSILEDSAAHPGPGAVSLAPRAPGAMDGHPWKVPLAHPFRPSSRGLLVRGARPCREA